jgi:hypothetical protein
VHVCFAKFPVLVGIVDAREESFALFLPGNVKEEFHDLRAVSIEMSLVVQNGAITALPNVLLSPVPSKTCCPFKISGCTRTINTSSYIGAIEDTYSAALWQTQCGAPQEVMIQFYRAWVLEAEDLASLRVDARHDMTNDSILAGSVHGLKDQQQCISICSRNAFAEENRGCSI